MKANTLFAVLSVSALVLAWMAGCTPAESVVDIQIEPAPSQIAVDPVPAGLRPVAQAILGGSITERLELVQFLTTPCTTADGLGGPPKCGEGQPDGTEVVVFPVGGAEGSFATEETIESSLDFVVIGLHAVYRVPEDSYSESYWPAGEYALLFDRSQNDISMPITARVVDGWIVRLDYQFGTTVEDVLLGIPVDNILVPPDAVPDWLAGTND